LWKGAAPESAASLGIAGNRLRKSCAVFSIRFCFFEVIFLCNVPRVSTSIILQFFFAHPSPHPPSPPQDGRVLRDMSDCSLISSSSFRDPGDPTHVPATPPLVPRLVGGSFKDPGSGIQPGPLSLIECGGRRGGWARCRPGRTSPPCCPPGGPVGPSAPPRAPTPRPAGA